MENDNQAVNVIVKMFLEAYSLMNLINLSPENEWENKGALWKIELIRADLDKCISILAEHAAKKNTLHCLTQIFNTLNVLDHCIWLTAREKKPDTFHEEIGNLRSDINILINLSLEISDVLYNKKLN